MTRDEQILAFRFISTALLAILSRQIKTLADENAWNDLSKWREDFLQKLGNNGNDRTTD